ncbi:MAG: 2-dehydropantoate 2-reductase [Myxococcota bacterium]|nr:2-dehydropantoate 2-reductase [Myxococcota bacterium]
MFGSTDAKTTLIIGAGAVGLGLGSCLHRAGRRIHFVVRPGPGPHPLEVHGFRRTGILGEVQIPGDAFGISRSLSELPPLDIEAILVCTKSSANPDLALALAALWRELPHPAPVVVCQNGWGNAEIFARALVPQHVASASILTGFRRSGDHVVEITVHARAIQIGSLYASEFQSLEPLCAAIDAGGIPCETSASIEADLGAKLLYNCLLNPLGALVGVPYGRLGEEAPTRALMEAVAHEVFAVLDAGGIQVHWPDAEHYLEAFYSELLPATADHESSMLQDLQAGRPTEIDSLCGAVVALGQKFRVATPVNAALLELIHAAERGAGRGET